MRGNTMLAGSAPHAAIQLDELSVAPEHARLRIAGERVLLSDLGSPMGTFLAGTRLPPHQEFELGEGAWLRLGGVDLVFTRAPRKNPAGSLVSRARLRVDSGPMTGHEIIVTERALVGSEEPVFDREGNRVGRRLRQSDRLLMFLIRAYGPDRFREAVAGRDGAPAATPVAEALAHLHPAPPAEPAALIAPDDLAVALEVADLCDGALPHWYRDDLGDNPEEAVMAPAAAPGTESPQG